MSETLSCRPDDALSPRAIAYSVLSLFTTCCSLHPTAGHYVTAANVNGVRQRAVQGTGTFSEFSITIRAAELSSLRGLKTNKAFSYPEYCMWEPRANCRRFPITSSFLEILDGDGGNRFGAHLCRGTAQLRRAPTGSDCLSGILCLMFAFLFDALHAPWQNAVFGFISPSIS